MVGLLETVARGPALRLPAFFLAAYISSIWTTTCIHECMFACMYKCIHAYMHDITVCNQQRPSNHLLEHISRCNMLFIVTYLLLPSRSVWYVVEMNVSCALFITSARPTRAAIANLRPQPPPSHRHSRREHGIGMADESMASAWPMSSQSLHLQ